MTEAGKRGLIRGALLVVLSLALSGCAGTGAGKLPQARQQAISFNQKGIAEEARGNREAALAEFRRSLKLHGSLENTDGMLVALVNIARTQRLKGDLPVARHNIERALTLLQEPSDLASELFFEKGKILLAAGEFDAAKKWALRAESAEKGESLGRSSNLVAAILLRQEMPDRALEQLEKALKANREAGSKGEEANSLRLLGEIHLAQGRPGTAKDCYLRALVLDKELGFVRKIALDLRGLGGVSVKEGDVKAAIGYYRRAMEVSLNGGDSALAADDLARLSELYQGSGDALSAVEMDDQRRKLTQKDAMQGG